MRAALLLLAVLASACATAPYDDIPVSPAPSGSVLELGPQQLAAGECGLFGWDNNSRFAFFATASRGQYSGTLSREPGAYGAVRLIPQDAFPPKTYRVDDPGGTAGERALTLDLGSAEAMIEGKRYAYAKVKEGLADGFVRVVPLIVIESCQTPDGPAF